MAEIIIPKRLVDVKFYQDNQIGSNKNAIQAIINKYPIIEKVSHITNIPLLVLAKILFIESAGQNAGPNQYKATGLMQVTPATANETIRYEARTNRLSAEEKEIIIKSIGQARFDCIKSQNWDAEKKSCNGNSGISITTDDLLKTELNILVGAMFAKQLMDNHTEGGLVRMDKVIVQYNGGRYTKIASGNPMQVYNSTKATETRNYIAKIGGINGLLETIT